MKPRSRKGLSPPGEHHLPAVSLATTTTTSACCLPSAAAPDDVDTNNNDSKYHKRSFQQRKQQRLRNAVVLLCVSLSLLGYTFYRTRWSPAVGSTIDDDYETHKSERQQEKQQQQQQQRRHHKPREGDNGGGQFYDDDQRRLQQHGPRPEQFVGERNHHGIPPNHRDDGSGDDGEEEDRQVVMKRRLAELEELEERMVSNTNKTIRWADMSYVPSLPGHPTKKSLLFSGKTGKGNFANAKHDQGQLQFYQVHRPESKRMAWEDEFDAITDKRLEARKDYVDYVHHKYIYPNKLYELPSLGVYPKLRTYKEIMEIWPQDNLDDPPEVIREDLMHFDFNNPEDMEAALEFRNAKLPFKLINVPELLAANEKWTDEYLAHQFDGTDSVWGKQTSNGPKSSGKCNEGPDNFFAFFNQRMWDVHALGMPPTRDNDWTFERWAKHAHYADRVGLDPNLPHYYWQSGVPREERKSDYSKWTFVSRDLPSFSSNEANFIQWKPPAQKGIQCRFGERGITAANHYDSGRNMIGMITGAKRYILSPPRACKKLGIVSSKVHASFRHSMLNYGHMSLLQDDDNDNNANANVPDEERDWLSWAGTAEAVSTVVKKGEILYVPTGWFHYITSLQKSAQCNVRSGPDMSGDEFFGGAADIHRDCFPHE